MKLAIGTGHYETAKIYGSEGEKAHDTTRQIFCESTFDMLTHCSFQSTTTLVNLDRDIKGRKGCQVEY